MRRGGAGRWVGEMGAWVGGWLHEWSCADGWLWCGVGWVVRVWHRVGGGNGGCGWLCVWGLGWGDGWGLGACGMTGLCL